MRRLSTITVAVLALTIAIPALAVTIHVADQFPVAGQPTEVRLTDLAEAGLPNEYRLAATYRPNSETTREVEVGSFGDSGTLSWTPADPGIVKLTAKGPDGTAAATGNVAVRFARTPASGILVMIVAGLVLFGGTGYFLVRAHRDGNAF